jgi:hypothetical protein
MAKPVPNIFEGNANKQIPIIAKQLVNSLPAPDMGTISP